MSDCIARDCSKALNWAICAMKSVSFFGFSGSCDVIWAISNLRKSSWSRTWEGTRLTWPRLETE